MAEAVKVIVVAAQQTKKFVCAALSETKFKKGEDWVVVGSEKEAKELIVRGKPQLLVVNGKLGATVFVIGMRKVNPALKAGCVSTGPGLNPEQYNYRVIQADCRDYTGLVEMVAEYLTLVAKA